MDSFGVSGLDSLVFVLISNTQRGRLHLLLEHLPGCCVFLYPGRVTDLEVGQNSTISKLFLPMEHRWKWEFSTSLLVLQGYSECTHIQLMYVYDIYKTHNHRICSVINPITTCPGLTSRGVCPGRRSICREGEVREDRSCFWGWTVRPKKDCSSTVTWGIWNWRIS